MIFCGGFEEVLGGVETSGGPGGFSLPLTGTVFLLEEGFLKDSGVMTNSTIGIPLTLLKKNFSKEFAIIETS